MANVTYRDLAKFIDGLSDEQKDTNVTVYVSEMFEFCPLVDDDCDGLYPLCEADETNQVIAVGHPYLTI